MHVLFSGGTSCSPRTLKRLVLLADEIGFADRPSVGTGTFGTVGVLSDMRRVDWTGIPVKIGVYDAPVGPKSDLYLRYFAADLANPSFRGIVWQGLNDGGDFASKLIQPRANYGWGTGEQVRQALLADPSILTALLDEELGPFMYEMDKEQGRRVTFKVALFEASIMVTNALLISEASQLHPVSDDPVVCTLLAQRLAGEAYVHQPTNLAAMLGLAVGRAVVSDEMLEHINLPALFEYRRGAQDVYQAWSAEMLKLSVKLEQLPPERVEVETAKIIVAEVQPKLKALNDEMEYARDKLFGDLVSKVTQWQVPTMSLAYLAGLGSAGAIAAFAGALAPAVPPIVDYFVKRRDITRKNSMAYLIGLSKDLRA